MPPPRLQWPASWIRPLSTVAPARGLDVEIYDEISEKACPVSVLAHLLPTGSIYSPFFSGTFSLTSDPRGGSATRPASPRWTPAREVAWSVLRENSNAPKNTYHPGFVETAIYQISAERGERSERYVFYSSTCDMCSSSSCDGATHVLSTLLRTVCPAYSSIYTSSSERARYTSMYRARARELLYEENQSAHFFGRQVGTVGYYPSGSYLPVQGAK